MNSPEIDVAMAFIDAINRHDMSGISGLMTEDHVFVDSRGEAHAGRNDMTAGWAEYFRMFPDYRIGVETILAEGTLVAIFGSASGTYNGTRGLVPENRIEMPAAWKAVVENGRIRLWQVYADWTEGVRIIGEDGKSGQSSLQPPLERTVPPQSGGEAGRTG